jgi:hypothetical protein
MARTLLVVDPDVGVSPADLAEVWEATPGSGGGMASVEAVRGRVLLPGVLEAVVLPVAVNLASSALVEVVRRLVGRARGAGGGPDFEVVETTDERGERVVVVRARRRP